MTAGLRRLGPESFTRTIDWARRDREVDVADEKTSEPGGGGSLLSGLIAPLRVPERALEALAGAAGDLAAIRSELSTMREQNEPLTELVPLTREIRAQIEPMPPTVERISGQAEPLEKLLPALERLEQAVVGRLEGVQETMKAIERDEARLNEQVRTLCGEMGTLQDTVSGLKGDVERITERLPDPTQGPIDKVREALTGKGDPPAGDGG